MPNVGDALGALIVEHVTGSAPAIVGEAPLDVPNLIAGGSIAHWADANSTLWGCGLIAEDLAVRAPARVLALRGPHTRDALVRRGIRCADLLGDAALLAPQIIAPADALHPVGVVPHYVDRDTPFVARCRREGIPVLDVSEPPERFVRALTSCARIISSSLHGVVLAHAYGRDALWLQLSERVHGGGFKFFDYYASCGIARRDVPAVDAALPIARIAERSWRPATLPDAGALRSALAEYAA